MIKKEDFSSFQEHGSHSMIAFLEG